MQHMNLLIATGCGLLAGASVLFHFKGLSLLFLLCAILFVLREKRTEPTEYALNTTVK